MTSKIRKIAILGGTGALGGGLARRWAKAGHEIIIGSRDAAKAHQAVADLKAWLAERGIEAAVSGADNRTAARTGDIAVLTVPFAHHRATLDDVRPSLSGKLLIDVTVPLMPPKVGTVQLPPEDSAAVAGQRLLGAEVRVVSAFQNVAAAHLNDEGPIDCDVLICSDDKAAGLEVAGLAQDAGMRAFYAGPLANSAATEALTSLLIQINRAFKCHAGIRLTGLPQE